MILNFIRALLLILLLFVIIVDFDLPIIISTATNQLFIAIIVLFLILTVDEIIGFITGLIFLIIYFKYYQKKINSHSQTQTQSNDLINTSLSNISSLFVSTPEELSTSTSTPTPTPFSSFINYFTTTNEDVKPKTYSRQPEIPEHYTQELKNDNCALIPYISTEVLKAAQNNIYNEDNYNTEIKQDNNFYGIQGLNSDNTHFAAFDNNYTVYNNL